ncbi:cytochrome c551 [Paenibacillus sp. XY044]|uniref:cytochrome c551 n=1 Tax=Paenibacillus sp. XY044 TaxID=2026089 RepID=UPI000B99A045|nr:cytochrome c [Paenibacillus sp. XY044]OZB93498.1 cytochrome c-551 [Paenibacillus sp. XY044]
MKKSIIFLSLLLVLSLSACGKSSDNTNNQGAANNNAGTTTGQTGGTAAAGNGEATFKANCVSCHGNNLEGAVGPNLQKIGAKYSADEIAGIVSNGRGGMPSFKGQLSDADIQGVAQWLATKK